MRTLAVIVLALAVSGCGKEEKGGKSSAKATAGAKSADISGLFTGTAPTLPAEVAALQFGQTKDEATKAFGEDPGYSPSKKYDKVTYDADFRKKEKASPTETLSAISVRANEPLEPILTKLWGPPVKTDKSPFWFNPTTGTRAHLPDHGKGETVTFDAYEPVEKILGEKGNAFTLAPDGKSLIGMTLAEFKTAMGDKLCRWDEEGVKLEKEYAEAAETWNNSLRNSQRTIHICNTVPRTVDKVHSRIFWYSSSVGRRPFSVSNFSTCWSIAVFMNIARIVGAGPLIVIDTLVAGSQRSKPEYSTFMSSSVAIDTPELPTLP